MTNRCTLKITNALVIDGSGAPGKISDVAIIENRIAQVGDVKNWKAETTIDGIGKVLSPGFIDVHTHDDLEVLRNPSMDCKISQGVTSVIAGNCGISIAPVSFQENMPAPFPILGNPEDFKYEDLSAYRESFERANPAVNLGLLTGHSSLRLNSMGTDLNRAATSTEIEKMVALLDESLKQGSIGLSSGLDYPPAANAPEQELVAIASVLSSYPDSVYASHIRDEGDEVMEAIEEVLSTGRNAQVPIIISHHKCAGKQNHGRSVETLKLIQSAQANQSVGLDVYPYIASSSSLIPQYIKDAEKIIVTFSEPHPEHDSRLLADIAEEWQCDLEEASIRLYPAGAIYFDMSEDDLQRILAFPSSMVGSDGLPSMDRPHPRLWGTFPRVLGHYVRELKLMSLEQGIHKMTGLSAKTFNLKDRGLIKAGHYADLVLFDADTIVDRATFENPLQKAEGIEKVFVNGILTWSDGETSGDRAGEFLKH